MAVQIQLTFGDFVWADFVATFEGATDLEKTQAAKAAIKDEFVKPRVLAARIREKRQALEVELQAYIAVQTGRLS